MYYSLIGFLALLILVITNHDVILKKADPSLVQKTYRSFLIAVVIYHVTDMLWGILEALSLTTLLYFDTEIYFIAMALGILSWTQYVVAYLDDKNGFSSFLICAGKIFFVVVTVITLLNLFVPVMFMFDSEGIYHALAARYIALIFQILLLFLTAFYALRRSEDVSGSKISRHRTIGLSGVIMLVFISIQIFFPYLPLYGIGYMMGCCLLRTFVIENENEQYRHDLEAALAREKKDLQELSTAWSLAYTDALTGVKSKLAFAEKEDQLDRAINESDDLRFAIGVFDINGLKQINDTQGHDAGDQYIKNACHLICRRFQHSPVYRVGGDEFTVVMEGQDYDNRVELIEEFNRLMEENNRSNDDVVVAVGYADFDPSQDNSSRRVFERADYKMYVQKNELKNNLGC